MRLDLYTADGELGWTVDGKTLADLVQGLALKLRANDPVAWDNLTLAPLLAATTEDELKTWCYDELDGATLRVTQ
jgi:hypothetical protein